MGKKETDEERRKRLAMESIARMKSALGGMKVPGGKAVSLDGVDKKGAKSPESMEEDMKKKLPGGSSSKRTASDDTVDGIMGMWKKKRK
jgi:hypothetical protein